MQNLIQKYTAINKDNSDVKARSVVLHWILIGSFYLSLAALLVPLNNIVFHEKYYLIPRAVFIACLCISFYGLHRIARHTKYLKAVGLIIVLTFFAIGVGVLGHWGISNPMGVLVLSLTIIMAGILLGAKYSLHFALYASISILFLQQASEQGILSPHTEWMQRIGNTADAFVFATLFLITSLVSWLFNRQMEHSLQRAHRSEAALKRQKAILEIRVEERTRELEKLQLEKMQQFYRFAELGRLSTSLFHDLANHLTTMNIDLEGLGKNDQSKMMQRLQHNAGYIDDVIRRVREQLLGKEETEAFNIQDEISEIVKILQPKATQAGVSIECESVKKNKTLEVNGSLTRFRQMIINVLSNAIDSYETTTKNQKVVSVAVSQNKTTIAIVITDEGCGIPPEIQRDIFKPFYSTKHNGVGIGLFIVKQITEQYFSGKLELNSSENIGSTFTIKIPKKFHESPAG